MRLIFHRAAVFAVALFLSQSLNAAADFSTGGLLGYLTGLRSLPDYYAINRALSEYPARLAEDNRSYFEMFGNWQDVFRNFSGTEKSLSHGAGAIGIKRSLLSNRAGVYLLYSERSGSVSWPFSKNRVRIREFYNSGNLLLSGFVSPDRRIKAGFTAGKSVNRGNRFMHVAQLSVRPWRSVEFSVSFSSVPYDWGIEAEFENVTKTLFSRFRHDSVEGGLTVPLRGIADVTVRGQKGRIYTPGGFRGVPDSHAQVWEADRDRWQVSFSENVLPRVDLNAGYARDKIPGELGLWYNGSRYMRGKLDVSTHRWWLEAEGENAPRHIPAVRYDRVATGLDLSRGIVDSWPFTPTQMEIIGDKTWTFSGTGSFVSNGCTFTWETSEQSVLSTSFIRAFPDYSLRITTRDHLSANPWDMIFGNTRIETDRTRYYDFASVMYRREFTAGGFSIDAGIQQLIPLRHAETKIPGKAPEPPSFPKLRLARPKRFGGLSLWGRVRYYLK